MLRLIFASLFFIPMHALSCDLNLTPTTFNGFSPGNFPEGHRFCLSAGVFYTSQPIELRSGQVVSGAGIGQTRIVSSASRAIVAAWTTGNEINNVTVEGSGEYSVLFYQAQNALVWTSEFKGALINIGINGSHGISFLNVFARFGGSPTNGLADPNVWIDSSNQIVWQWGGLDGQANWPHGDGELACYNSRNVTILDTESHFSGTSAFYFVNCDDSSVSRTEIYNCGGWGLDVVGGSDGFVADDVLVQNCQSGGAVFEELGFGATALFRDVIFLNNRRNGWNAPCNGVNVIGSIGSVSLERVYSSPSGSICTFYP